MSANNVFYTVTVQSEAQTAILAHRLSNLLLVQDVVTLNGTLGAGKTSFARALIRAFVGSEIDVPSPTFNLLLTYECEQASIYHYDFYRLEDPEEVWELDIEDAYEEGITIIEWVQRLGGLAPEEALSITFSIPKDAPEGVRVISFSGNDTWQKRLRELAV